MDLYRAYFRLPAVQSAALIYFLLAGVLTQIPLFNYLGYEFSALMTLPVALCTGMITITLARVHLARPLSRQTWMFILADYLFINGLLLLIPFAVMSANALAVKNCSFTSGAAYYILLPGITMIFSVSLGMITAMYFKRARLVFTLIVAALLIRIVITTYFLPQLFAYNTILGYFPGITYDELLSDLSTLVLFREFTFTATIMLWVWFFFQIGDYEWSRSALGNLRALVQHKPHPVLAGAFILCALIVIGGELFGNALGFEYSRNYIREQIGRRTESDHFIIYYSERNASAIEAKAIKAKAEYQYWTLVERLHLRPAAVEKTEIYLYPDAEAKRKFIGAALTNIAKPWLHEIHLQFDVFDQSFRHELVHALASQFGSPVIKASIRLGMNEGLAVATDWDEGLFTPHEYSAALLRDSLMGDVESLFHITGFSTQQSTYAYLVAGSFSRYMIDRFGIEQFKKVFRSGNFMGIYGRPLTDCVDAWKQFLATVDCSLIPPETVKLLFTQQSIFRKTCARVTAEKNRRGLNLLREKQYARAESEFASSFDDAKTAYSLRGLFSAYLLQQKPSELLAMYDAFGPRSLLALNPSILLLAGDACVQRGEFARAMALYHRAEDLHYSESFTDAAVVRRLGALDTGLARLVQRATYGGMDDTLRGKFLRTSYEKEPVESHAGVIAFLLANEYRKNGDAQAAGLMYEKAAYALTDASAKFGAARLAGDVFFEIGLYDRALAALWYANNFVYTKAQAFQLDERSDLINFVERSLEE
ncbi:MAG TPA: hypothetical protein VK470_11860 [Bacteroidota bacterium]|nr:hypothetical protein [Bacteroidota bacterium]